MCLAAESGQLRCLAVKNTVDVHGFLCTPYSQAVAEAEWRLLFQDLDIPDHMKELYKTVWEIKQKVHILWTRHVLSVVSAKAAVRCAAS